MSWVIGHVVLSIAAPIAVAEGLFPSIRRRQWVGRGVMALVGVLGVGVATLIRYDVETMRASATETAVSAAVVLTLVAVAFSRWCRPRPADTDRKVPSLALTASAGFVGMLAFDLAPASWFGLALGVSVAGAAALLVAWKAAPSTRWTVHHVVALAWGALTARAAIGFLVPIPDGVTATAKYTQNAVLLAFVIGIGVALGWEQRRDSRR